MLRLCLAAHIFVLAHAYFEACKSPAPDIVPASSFDCSPGDACDASFLVVDGCVMTCSKGQVKFVDQTGKWTAAQEKVTYNAALGLFTKSAGGASKTMSTPTCIIEPVKCTGLLLFDGREPLLASNPSYQYISTAPSIRHNKYELVCPADYFIGYAESASSFKYDTTMVVTCESAGWWVTSEENENGVELPPVKYGCFKKVFVPTANCPVPFYLTESLLAPWVGVSVDNVQTTVEYVNGLNMLKCGENTLFAYIAKNVLTRTNWWLACDNNARNGWRVRDAGGKNTNYGKVAVGCVRPTCTGLQYFDESDDFILMKYPTHQIVPTQPSLVTNGKFTLTCLGGSQLGIESSATTISFDTTAKITCERDGWWVTSSSDLNGRLLTTRAGCFKQ